MLTSTNQSNAFPNPFALELPEQKRNCGNDDELSRLLAKLVIQYQVGSATSTPAPTATATNTPMPTFTATPTQPPAFTSADFVYDGDGRRVKSIIGGETTLFIGAHYEVTNGVVTKYYFAGAQRIAMRKNGTLIYMLTDHLGSTSMTTNASGALISQLKYKAWGETRYSSGSTPTNYKYTGQREEAGFGLYFYNARWYDPVSGRFSQADTIVPAGVQGLDRYAYVNNSPLNFVDPTGYFTEDAIEKYLKNTYGKNWKDYWDTWSADTDWWDMLLTAQAGDVLFGSFGGGNTTWSVTFTGSGTESLTGIDTSNVANDLPAVYSDELQSLNLADIQNGQKSRSNPDGSEGSWLFNWAGFYRTDESGKPSFYVRPGHEMKQITWEPWASDWTDSAAGAAIGSIGGPWGTFIGLVSGGLAPSLVSDSLNMEPYDVNVQVGPVQFNFQLQPGGNWELENGPNYTPDY